MKGNEEQLQVCCLCGEIFVGYGNNPDGAAWKDENGNVILLDFKENDRCCDKCNNDYVIPGRIYRMAKERTKK